MPLIKGFCYRPEIDGLRALAVVSVVLFHAGLGLPGGFVGVDVFFVISGFLITSLIWKDLENGKFTMLSFWERRARRIAPALLVVTMAALIAGWFILLPVDYLMLGKAARDQVLFIANHFYWRNTHYFAAASDEMPLLHTWSLAVEEQFYLLMPVILALLFRIRMLRHRLVVFSALTLGFAVSLGISIYGTTNSSVDGFNPSAAFYLLPSRAWELLLGSLMAFMPALPNLLRGRISRELLSAAGLGMILYPAFAYDSTTLFPGLAAFPPCLGAALFIWANGPMAGEAATNLSKIFAWRPIVFVGLISYSLYLWHWPLLAFGKYLSLGEASLILRVALVGLGFLLAIGSWKFVESPFRERTLGATTRSMFAYAGSGTALVLVLALVCRHSNGFPNRIAPEQRKFVEASFDKAFLNELTTEDVVQGNLITIGSSESTTKPAVMVWGDSHAMAAMPAIDTLLKDQGIAGVAATHSATLPVLNWYQKVSRAGLGPDSISYNQAVFEYIQQQKIPDVILISHWNFYLDHPDHGPEEKQLGKESLLKTVEQLVAIGVQPWIMLEVPNQGFDIPKVLSRPLPPDADVDSFGARPQPSDEKCSLNAAFVFQIEAAGGRVIDPKPCFLDPKGERYLFQSDGIVFYRDHSHLTTAGAKKILMPLFREHLVLAVQTSRLPGKSLRTARKKAPRGKALAGQETQLK